MGFSRFRVGRCEPSIRLDGQHEKIRLAKSYGRNGYRKVAELLRIEGWRVNHKKVERLWSEEGLQQPQRHKKRKRLY
ncbi:IS3 family transposase, partial [Roseovarius confluentis]|uniref:IS3 family transposase n=1 Tax=Roseovarius confluentis TaxID=1852027 RepID=UPI003CCBC481